MRQFVLSHEPPKFEGVRRDAREVAAHHFEQGRVLFPVCERGDMGEARAPRLGVADERYRALDVAQRPQCERETKHRRDTGVVSEPESQIVVAPGLKQGERAPDDLALRGARQRTNA